MKRRMFFKGAAAAAASVPAIAAGAKLTDEVREIIAKQKPEVELAAPLSREECAASAAVLFTAPEFTSYDS